jgi:hypothetical protein
MHVRDSADDRAEGRQAGEWARRFLVVVVAALVLGTLANIVMEASYKPESRALMMHEGGSLSIATATEPSASRGRYWITSIVHDTGFGGIVVVPQRSVINWYIYESLADVEVVAEDYNPELTPEMAEELQQYPSIVGIGNLKGLYDFKPFRVVMSPEGPPVAVYRVWYLLDMIYLVDDRVLTPETNL